MRTQIDSPADPSQLHPYDISFGNDFWNTGDRQASAIYRVDTAAGTNVLLDVLSDATHNNLRKINTITPMLQRQTRLVDSARGYLQVHKLHRGKPDWRNDKAGHQAVQCERLSNGEASVRMEWREKMLLEALKTIDELTRTFESIRRLAGPLLIAQLEHGATYFTDYNRVARYTVTAKCIDAHWLDAQGLKRLLVTTVHELNKTECLPFTVHTGMHYKGGHVAQEKINVNDTDFWTLGQNERHEHTRTRVGGCNEETVNATSRIFASVNDQVGGMSSKGPIAAKAMWAV